MMKRLLTLALVCVALGALPGRSAAQEEQAMPDNLRCPRAYQQTINLTAPPPAAANPNLPDFPACVAEPSFGGSVTDTCFRHTFTWELPRPECRCLSGELTLQYKALQGGPAGSSTSANDTVALYSGGSVVPGTSQPLYTGAVTPGQTGTKTIPLSCVTLVNQRLSFLVQDDTSVTSAALRVSYCCRPCPPGQVEMTFPGTDLKYCCEGNPGDPRFCCTAKKEVKDRE